MHAFANPVTIVNKSYVSQENIKIHIYMHITCVRVCVCVHYIIFLSQCVG